MFGGSLVGTLNVYTQGTSQNIVTVMTISGNQGANWQKAEISIQRTDGLKVIFETVRINSWQSDIAIDSVMMTPGLCGMSYSSLITFIVFISLNII
ncbi:hypothetical protein FSP39_010947 [Pinctada imbricata]|uniref:MAM domain-containing protein n=1 Tax=Pinctada imbricata TaxID=66713 RepID=A0AA88XLZ2_PINIB|nr:hypothetical protein FSP39_010947 [Pinctada imbricata]